MSVFPGISPFFSGAERMQPGIGADEELVQRAALLQIKENLPEMVLQQEALWNARDLAFAQGMGWQFKSISIEVPETGNFYLGARPSLVEAPIKFWPSITVRSNSARASTGDQLDQMDVFDVPMIIEVLCKAGPVPQTKLHDKEGINTDGMVDAQSQRLTAAVIGCIAKDKTLGGVVAHISHAPSVTPSMPFSRPGAGKGGTGDYYVFQGKMVQYIVNKFSY